MLISKLHQSRGMTLVELMVAIAITAVVMGLSLSFFLSQYKSYHLRKGATEITQTAPVALEMIKNDLMEAGWGVHTQMAFYIQDGGGSGPDRIFINDTSLIGANEVDRFVGNDCPGCADIVSVNGKDVTISTLYIADEKKKEGNEDFKKGSSMYVMTDAEEITFQGNKITVDKVAKINEISGNTLTLDRSIDGSSITPVIRYACERSEGVLTLRRSDRRTSGRQPMMENAVDLQVAFSTDSGESWFCDGGHENDQGSNGCPDERVTVRGTSKGNISPAEINLLRVTLVTRSGFRDVSRIHDPNYCRPAVENRAGAALGSDECGYHYRTHTRVIRPRNFGKH